jgi:hypothetical protein
LDLLREHPLSLLLGTGNAAQRAFVKSFGIEVEPVYLLVNYGISGFFLRYGLLLVLFRYATSLWRRSDDPFSHSLAGSTLCAIVVYLAFSMGFFFFQELHVGTFPWLLFGWTAGEHHRTHNRRDHLLAVKDSYENSPYRNKHIGNSLMKAGSDVKNGPA